MKNTNYYNVTDNPLRLLFDKKAISYGRAQTEVRKLEKEIKDLDMWFDKHGEVATNKQFFTKDYYLGEASRKLKELKEKLCL